MMEQRINEGTPFYVAEDGTPTVTVKAGGKKRRVVGVIVCDGPSSTTIPLPLDLKPGWSWARMSGRGLVISQKFRGEEGAPAVMHDLRTGEHPIPRRPRSE